MELKDSRWKLRKNYFLNITKQWTSEKELKLILNQIRTLFWERYKWIQISVIENCKTLSKQPNLITKDKKQFCKHANWIKATSLSIQSLPPPQIFTNTYNHPLFLSHTHTPYGPERKQLDYSSFNKI